MTYDQTIDFLHSCHTSVYNGLQRISYLLDTLGNPQNTFPSVLIAGTNGKGSTAKMISTVLQEAGYRVGCFTSPHLIDFTERISIENVMIPHAEVIALTEEIRNGALRELERDRHTLHIEGEVCFFEMVTAMAFVYFARQHIDIAVLEVGVGGRLDATNTVNPLISTLTNVGLDHQQWLGNTIAEIAREKSGIIREQGIVVTGSRNPEALAVIETVCHRQHAKLYQTGRDDPECTLQFAVHTVPQKISSTGSFFSYQGLASQLDDLYLRLAGIHQLSNAAVALCTLELLTQQGFPTSERAIRAGLANVVHPGRLEVLHTAPMVVVDIAHNAMGARTIANALTALFEYEKLIVVIGVLHDKDVHGILRPFLEVADALIFTSPHNTERAEAAAATAQIAEEIVNTALHTTYEHWDICESVEIALHQARKIAGVRDLICVTGSNYTVSEAEILYSNATKARRHKEE